MATKPKTLPFTRIELEYCKEVTKKLFEHPLAKAYIRPVNPELDKAYDYFDVIHHPMDLGTIKKRLENGEYQNTEEWMNDIKLVWDNAKTYNNDKKHLFYKVADRLSKKCNEIFKRIPKDESEYWALKLSKANAKLTKFLQKIPSELSSYPRLPEYTPTQE